MKRKKRGYFARMWWKIRHPWAWARVITLDELHRKRVIDEWIKYDYEINQEYYDREFEKEFNREWKERMEGKPEELPPVSIFLPPVHMP